MGDLFSIDKLTPIGGLINPLNIFCLAQWVEWSLPTPEIRSSNPYISKFYLSLKWYEKKIKRPGMAKL